VAVGVDPPLSQHDIELIRNLSRYTPNISLLLTKVDVLDEGERVQVRRRNVRDQQRERLRHARSQRQPPSLHRGEVFAHTVHLDDRRAAVHHRAVKRNRIVERDCFVQRQLHHR